jgi:CheY-like chemotaxis protein
MTRILVIDDDPLVRATLSAILEGAGYDVTLAVNGQNGLDEFSRRVPDMVITDIVMPEIEGIETIRVIRASAPTLPIVAISGGGRSVPLDYLRMAQRLGATDVLQKPFEADELVGIVSRYLPPSTAAG